jgi:hypothetical protein
MHMWSWGLRNIFIWPFKRFQFLPSDFFKLSLTLRYFGTCLQQCSIRFSLRHCAGNDDRRDATSFLTSWQPRQFSPGKEMWVQLGWDTSQSNLPTRLGHQPIQSSNLVWTPADSIFQLGWDTSRFNLPTRFGNQQIQSSNLVWTPKVKKS